VHPGPVLQLGGGGVGRQDGGLARLAEEADGADLEAEPLVGVPEVIQHDVDDGNLVDAWSVDLQHRLGVALFQRAAVRQGLDEGVVVVGHLLVVGAQEAQRLVVAVGLGVVPGHRLVADVGEVLPRRRAQQLQERHLHRVDGAVRDVHVI